MAPPYRALAIALTGAHMVVRSGFTIDQISLFQLTSFGILFAYVIFLDSLFFLPAQHLNFRVETTYCLNQASWF